MPPVQASASVVATGLGIRYIGEHCYGYNIVDVTNTEASLLETTTGSGYIVATIQFNYGEANTDNYRYRIYFNDEIIQVYVIFAEANYSRPDNVIPVIIPPFTKVRTTAANVSSSDGIIQACTIVGRVYGAE